MYTLRQASEIRAMSQIEELDRVPTAIKPAEAQLARQVIETFHSDLDLKVYRDDYQAELRRVIDAKIAGEEVVATPDETPTKVVDLMEALRRSLDAVSAGKKAPAKAELPKGKSKKAPAPVAAAAAEPAKDEKPARKRKAS